MTKLCVYFWGWFKPMQFCQSLLHFTHIIFNFKWIPIIYWNKSCMNLFQVWLSSLSTFRPCSEYHIPCYVPFDIHSTSQSESLCNSGQWWFVNVTQRPSLSINGFMDYPLLIAECSFGIFAATASPLIMNGDLMESKHLGVIVQ